MLILSKIVKVKDDASFEAIEDAKITADRKGWKYEHIPDKELTDLNHKCGSCMYFSPKEYCNSHSYGDCLIGHAWGARTRPACKHYKKKEDEEVG